MRKRKAFWGVTLACVLLLTSCGAQTSSAAPASQAPESTAQSESQHGNIFQNSDANVSEGRITVLTNVTEGDRLGRIEEICSRIRRKISRNSDGGIRIHRRLREPGENSFVWLGLWRCPADSEHGGSCELGASTLYRWERMKICRNSITVLTTALTTVWYTEFRCRCSSRESSITKRFSRKLALRRSRARLMSLWTP